MTQHIADDQLFIKGETLNYHIAATERPKTWYLKNPNFLQISCLATLLSSMGRASHLTWTEKKSLKHKRQNVTYQFLETGIIMEVKMS